MVSNAPQRILLINDESQLQGRLEEYCAQFRGGPWILTCTADAAKGLSLLQSGRFVVCLLDFQLDGGKGEELLRTAGGNDCPTPVIFLLNDAREEAVEAAMEAGAMD